MEAHEILHMTYQQYRTVRQLVHECCNYDCGNCLLLDNGEECVCPQSITYSLICKWFCAAVLPLVSAPTAVVKKLFPLREIYGILVCEVHCPPMQCGTKLLTGGSSGFSSAY